MKAKFIIPILLLVLCFLFLTDYRKTPGAEFIRYLGAENLLLRQTLILDNFPAQNLGVDKAKVNNHWFSAKTLGDHLLEVPARAFFFFIHSENTRYFLVRVFSTMLIVAFLLNWIYLRYGLLIALTVLLGTPAWHEVRFTHSDLVGGAIALAGIFSLEKKRFGLGGLLFGLAFLVRYQLSVFLGPFLLIFSVRHRKEKKIFVSFVPFIFSIFIQMLVNWHYFGSPFLFNVHFWAPDPPEAYEGISTVIANNHVLKWSVENFKELFSLQFSPPDSMFKWMFWFYPALFFLRKYPLRMEYLAGILAFHLYLFGIKFWGFRYYGSFCFLCVPLLIHLPKIFLYLILAFGIIFVNVPGEWQYLRTLDNQPLLMSKFGVDSILSLVPSILLLGAWFFYTYKKTASTKS